MPLGIIFFLLMSLARKSNFSSFFFFLFLPFLRSPLSVCLYTSFIDPAEEVADAVDLPALAPEVDHPLPKEDAVVIGEEEEGGGDRDRLAASQDQGHGARGRGPEPEPGPDQGSGQGLDDC